ncbi:MAG: ABC transporter ATP-binding protein [Gordonibacter pamelaeae]
MRALPVPGAPGEALARGSRAGGARARAGERRAVPRLNELRRLSGGERQRAFIAMTLAQDTDLIVLDEPTTYLDIRACHETMELVRRLNVEAGKTVVMVIHDLDLALRYSDRLLVMERGRATAAGTVGEVLATGAIERAFGVSIRACAAPEGTAYTLFPA